MSNSTNTDNKESHVKAIPFNKQQPMYLVADKQSPQAVKLGKVQFAGNAYDIFESHSEALKFQLKSGLRATTEVIEC